MAYEASFIADVLGVLIVRYRLPQLWVAMMALGLAACAGSNSGSQLQAVLRSKPDAAHGAELFKRCAVCHGLRGEGVQDGGVPRIGGQHSRVLAKQLVDYRHGQRWDIRMEEMADKHHLVDAQSIADVAAFVNQLQPDSAPGMGDGSLVEEGARLYAERCERCHAAAATGNPQRLVPRLAGQHYEYLQRQIYDAVDGRRPNLSRPHVTLLQELEREDIVAVADYLSRLNRDTV